LAEYNGDREIDKPQITAESVTYLALEPHRRAIGRNYSGAGAAYLRNPPLIPLKMAAI
jgi:hypothetical protein